MPIYHATSENCYTESEYAVVAHSSCRLGTPARRAVLTGSGARRTGNLNCTKVLVLTEQALRKLGLVDRYEPNTCGDTKRAQNHKSIEGFVS